MANYQITHAGTVNQIDGIGRAITMGAKNNGYAGDVIRHLLILLMVKTADVGQNRDKVYTLNS